MQRVGPYLVDWKSCELQGALGKVRFTVNQLGVLRLLMAARGRIVTKERFHAEVWKDQAVEDGNLTQCVFLLRRALGKLPDGTEMIETVPRQGYRLAAGALTFTRVGAIEGIELERRFELHGDEPFRLLIESITDYAIYMLDVSGRVLTWNKGAERNKGFGSEDVIGHHYSIFFVPEDVHAHVPERELASAATHGHCSGEGWRLHKSGECFWAGFSITALRRPDGGLLGFAKVVKDLTEKKRQEDVLARTEAELRRERDRLRAAAESSLDALFICEALRDENGEIVDFIFTYLNQNVEELVTIPRKHLLGGRMCQLLPLNLESGLFEAYKRVAVTGEPFLTEVLIDSGSVKANWVRIQAVRLDEGVAITASDIGKQKELHTRHLTTD